MLEMKRISHLKMVLEQSTERGQSLVSRIDRYGGYR